MTLLKKIFLNRIFLGVVIFIVVMTVMQWIVIINKIVTYENDADFVITDTDTLQVYEIDTNGVPSSTTYPTADVGEPGDIVTISISTPRLIMSFFTGVHTAIILDNGIAMDSPGFPLGVKVGEYPNSWGETGPNEHLVTISDVPAATPEQIDGVVNSSSEYLGDSYDYIFQKWNGDKYYCSELIWNMYLNQGINLSHGIFVTPNELLASRQTELQYVETKFRGVTKIYYTD